MSMCRYMNHLVAHRLSPSSLSCRPQQVLQRLLAVAPRSASQLTADPIDRFFGTHRPQIGHCADASALQAVYDHRA